MSGRIAVVTGATQGLGQALVQGLAARMGPDDVVYLTGRDPGRVEAAVSGLTGAAAQVRGAVLDVGTEDGAATLAERLESEHGGVDVVIGNAVMRVGPDDDPRTIVTEYVEVNNLGTTRLMRAFSPRLREGGRFLVVASSLGSLDQLAPVLHHHFDDLPDLDAVDDQVLAWRDAVADGSARGGAWPAFVNIPSKIGQVAAVRTLAASRRADDLARGTLVAAVCPGMINTPTSGLWWDVSDAPTPDQAAVALLDLALGEIDVAALHGLLVRAGEVVPWRSEVG